MVISDYVEDGVLKSVFRTSTLWVRESFSAMATALQRKDFVDPLAALTTDRGNLCEATIGAGSRSQSQKSQRGPPQELCKSRFHDSTRHRNIGRWAVGAQPQYTNASRY